MARYLLPILAATAVLAKTDLAGCTSLTSTIPGSSGNSIKTVIHYVPDTLEICTTLDCGGTDNAIGKKIPGCPGYSGTETITKSLLPSCATVKPPTVTVTQTLAPPGSNSGVGSTTVTITPPTTTSTIVKTVTTSPTASLTVSGQSGITTGTSGAGSTLVTSTEGEAAPTGTGSGAEPSPSTVPAGAGSTARAEMAAVLGVAAAVVAFA
ncbi:hypothetical protein BDP81DRAFT_456140 [Colletotrichum phormii]|uniref:Uncharacterized protein n=1 Tax=Colletotrichum phormii TaxID=359342 RepID=A0AAJ0E9B5_9PEZI|nr:uncharacterized protein BDP81DRAFT_456140 [Colletotrichum phormii]KAK1621542.1 hypothetical protein BDP81DRAFT_456140 [Colletotrichum phormii]